MGKVAHVQRVHLNLEHYTVFERLKKEGASC